MNQEKSRFVNEFYFETPKTSNYEETLYYNLRNELLKAEKFVYVTAYLLTNYKYYELLKQLSKRLTVKIFSIPIDGYEIVKKKIEDRVTTAYFEAKKIYDDALRSIDEHFQFFIFPHWWVKVRAGFQRTQRPWPYSLHLKAVITDRCSVLTSCNFEKTFSGRYEDMVISRDPFIHDSFLKFFRDFEMHSIPLSEWDYELPLTYKLDDNRIRWFQSSKEYQQYFNKAFFMAPFYTYSNRYVWQMIKELINRAKKRVWIVSQHFLDTKPLHDPKEAGLVQAVCERKKNRKDLDVKVTWELAVRLAKRKYESVIEMLDEAGITYIEKRNVHSKIIVIDDIVVSGSINLTPTTFYNNRIQMPFLLKEDWCSNVELACFFDDRELLSKYENYIQNYIWQTR